VLRETVVGDVVEFNAGRLLDKFGRAIGRRPAHCLLEGGWAIAKQSLPTCSIYGLIALLGDARSVTIGQSVPRRRERLLAASYRGNFWRPTFLTCRVRKLAFFQTRANGSHEWAWRAARWRQWQSQYIY
jgi:hypothetical protein